MWPYVANKKQTNCFVSLHLFYFIVFIMTHTFADNIKVPYLGERPKQYTFKFDKI